MQPVIEVQCPFCKARGQIVTPPLGAIIVGPCPRCSELVLLFCGAVLPLDKEIILRATAEDKKTHLTETIMEMVVNRIDELVDNAEAGNLDEHEVEVEATAETPTVDAASTGKSAADAGSAEGIVEVMVPSVAQDGPTEAITDEEVRDFLDIDLHLVDRKVHFDRVFGHT